MDRLKIKDHLDRAADGDAVVGEHIDEAIA